MKEKGDTRSVPLQTHARPDALSSPDINDSLPLKHTQENNPNNLSRGELKLMLLIA